MLFIDKYNNYKLFNLTYGNLSQNGTMAHYNTSQLAMDGVYSWIMNCKNTTMNSKIVHCNYAYDAISGALNSGSFLLIGFRNGSYAHITAHSYWGARAISIGTIENGAWASRFDRVITNTDLNPEVYIVPKPSDTSTFTFSNRNFQVYVRKSGKVVTIQLNISGSMAAVSDFVTAFTIPQKYKPLTGIVINYVTQNTAKSITLLITQNGEVKFTNFNTSIDDWLCRQCITYVTDN